MNNKTLIGAGILLLAVVLVLAYFSQSPAVKEELQTLGGISGPKILTPFLAVNGLRTYYFNVGMDTSSSTLCSIPSPAGTSTIDSFRAIITTATGTAVQVLLEDTAGQGGQAITSAASSSNLLETAGVTIGANATGTVYTFTPTSTVAIGRKDVIGPSRYITFRASSTAVNQAGTGTVFGGRCSGRFTEL